MERDKGKIPRNIPHFEVSKGGNISIYNIIHESAASSSIAQRKAVITTVTPTTISILTTAALAGSLSLIVIFVLIALLIQKELTTAAGGSRLKRVRQMLNMAIVPLLIVFILTVIVKVTEVLK